MRLPSSSFDPTCFGSWPRKVAVSRLSMLQVQLPMARHACLGRRNLSECRDEVVSTAACFEGGTVDLYTLKLKVAPSYACMWMLRCFMYVYAGICYLACLYIYLHVCICFCFSNHLRRPHSAGQGPSIYPEAQPEQHTLMATPLGYVRMYIVYMHVCRYVNYVCDVCLFVACVRVILQTVSLGAS